MAPDNSLAPYERRVIELLRNSKDKRARKLAKKRVRYSIHAPFPLRIFYISSHPYPPASGKLCKLVTRMDGTNRLTFDNLQLGTFGRAKRKVDELQGVIAESRRAGH